MVTILGIDPGSRLTGYGIIQSDGRRLDYVCSGTVRTVSGEFSERLHEVYAGIVEVISTHQPHEVAIEQVFMSVNASSALKLGHARGAAIVAVTAQALTVAEYSPRQIKQAVVGHGGAEKFQVQHMVRSLLNLSTTPPEDAADALAVAICHAHRRGVLK